MGGTGFPLDIGLRNGYLRRLGLQVEPPSIDALQRLHRRHAERIPYETMWIQAREAWSIDPVQSVERIVLEQRGGYCYHLNGALSLLLQSLGYAVTRHVGAVHGPGGPDAASIGNHLVLTVDGLSTSENPHGVWYVDVGLGDALHDALPLVAGTYEQSPFSLALTHRGGEGGGWHLTHDPAGGFVGMDWTSGVVAMDDFVAKHEWLSTSPESGFVRVPMAEHRDATGVDVVRGLVRSRIGEESSSEPLTRRADWFECLADLFDLRFESSTPAALDRLWDNAVAAHREWESIRAE